MSISKQSYTLIHDLLLHDAASIGEERRLEELKGFLRLGKLNINSKDEDWGNRTALHCAAEGGMLNMETVYTLPSQTCALRKPFKILTIIVVKCYQ